MHMFTARDMIRNTQQSTNSAYDGILTKKQKLNLKNWRGWKAVWTARRQENTSAVGKRNIRKNT